jgi:heat-inducible transcriptional repressor
VVICHIRLGVPIGSRTITKLSEIGLSPATIRNVMADLEELGYLTHPHTSAGRVPTEKGYRYYVDHLLREVTEWPESPATTPHSTIARPDRPERAPEILQNASRLLSQATNYAGVALAPKLAQRTFKQIEFIGLRPGQVLAIFVSEEGLLHQTLFQTDRDISGDELDAMADHLNRRFRGRPLQEVQSQILRDMQEVKERYDSLLSHALQLGGRAIDTPSEGDLYVEGATNILTQIDFTNVEEMRQLFRTFEDKYRLLRMLEHCLETPGVQVFIGSENTALGPRCSMVVAAYECDGRPIGSVGVIGPTRMDYSSVIPLVQSTAKQLSQFFEDYREESAR